MVAVPLTGPQRWVVVASPGYIETHGAPQNPSELDRHNCIQLLLGDDSNYPWELREGDSEKAWRVPGNITVKDTATTIAAAKSGVGLAYVIEARVKQELAEGSLQIVLEENAAAGEPFHIYYASRRHNHPGLRELTNIIRRHNGFSPI
jgi:DNA-binding transcriptional LysR family regulator